MKTGILVVLISIVVGTLVTIGSGFVNVPFAIKETRKCTEPIGTGPLAELGVVEKQYGRTGGFPLAYVYYNDELMSCFRPGAVIDAPVASYKNIPFIVDTVIWSTLFGLMYAVRRNMGAKK
jgi:hypothetical protein